MTNQVITINRKKYAVGLFWQPTGAGYVPRAYARSLARGIDKKLKLFTEYRGMVGLGSRRVGHHSGMDSVAAAITDALGEFSSFLAVFAVSGAFLLVAVRNGVILEDKLFTDENTARAEYFKLSEIPDWGALIAPSAWGMPRAIERNVSDLISRAAHYTLRPISRAGAVFASVVLFAMFIVLAIWFFREPLGQMFEPRLQPSQLDPELVAEYNKQIEEKNKELDAQFEIEKPQPPQPLVMPYDYLPDPMARARTCYQAIAFLMQPVTGWNQTVVECNETHASTVFDRTFGTVGDFYMVASQLMPASFVQQQSDNSLYVRATLPAVQTRASLDERDVETVYRAVLTAFQSIDTPVDAQMVVDTLTNGVDTAYLNIVEVAAESKLIPMQFMQIFDDFGGVYMTRCEWDADARIWNYEVIIYAK